MTETGIGTNIAIRGIFSGVNQGFEQSVGTYIDGIHYGRAQQSRAPFLDVAAGRSAARPAVDPVRQELASPARSTSSRPSRPTSSRAMSRAATSRDYDDYELVGVVSGPITDRVRARVAGRYHDGDGYYARI